MTTPSLQVGVADCDITPPIGTPMAGGLRPRRAESVGTRLSAQAIVFDDGRGPVAIMDADLCVLPGPLVQQAKRLIAERAGIPGERVLMAASHTHAGPYTAELLTSEPVLDACYLELLPRYLADAATLAYERRGPARVGAGAGRHEASAHYRRVRLRAGHVRNTWMKLDPAEVIGPMGEIDPEVGVLLAARPDGSPLAVVFNYALHANCHPAPRNRIDGSYPVRVDERLRGAAAAPALYLPGACGNINPTTGPEETADALAREILSVIDGLETAPEATLWAGARNVTLPLRDFSELRIDAIRRDWPEGEDVFVEEWRRLREAGDTEVETCVQALVIGEIAVVAAPGELFVELGREIKQRSPFPLTFVSELANDYVGYIPHRAAYDEGGYELLDARSAKVAPEAGEIVVETALDLLAEAKAAG